ncbi:glycosyltransferase [Acaryochloris sp. 'Moss Beach']|uniref:glycosyltransferase n=1 Tax=Acaryochloris sp. 'Moss Beach' TaxID=2740837 RepID=UPI001F36CF96|nr:glycosyltransferase [Acaryochloris sp. 'Moss Beach']UJB69818.1 glycosyltransferase [Acaryochloris sp. 'Moss Beach']
MRLLVVVPALGSVYGGPSKSVIELAQSLGKSSINVDVIATNANGDSVLDVPLGQWIQKDHYRVQYFPYWGIGDYKLSLPITSWLFRHIRDYDLVQTNAIFSVPILPAYLACRWNNIPYVVIPRGMLEPWALSYKAWKKRIYYDLFEKPALMRASAIQMLASTEAKQIRPLNLEVPLIISPNGIHPQAFEILPSAEEFFWKFPETQNKKLILFLGRIDPKKGLDLLSQAFGKIKHQFSDAHLVVAGPDNIGFLSMAQQYFTDANCLSAVTFTGMLTGTLKYAALAAADVYVAPSYSEGFSMSVLEGMVSGLPCIISTGCNFPEAETAKAAHVVEPNPDAISSALLHCLHNPEESKQMGDLARQFILANYTWDKITAQLIEVYSAILNNPSISHQTPISKKT